MNEYKNVHVIKHPLCEHNLSIIRNEKTTAPIWYYNKIPAEFEQPENKIIIYTRPDAGDRIFNTAEN